VAALAVGAAAAADYPYSGFYTVVAPEVDVQQGQLQCAYNFFVQNKDGSYVSYHLDLQRYLADRTIRFVEYSRGSCVLDEGGKVETCTSSFDTDPSEQGKASTDVFRQAGSGAVNASFFDEIAAARAFAATGAGTPAYEAHYSLCADFTVETMGKYLSADRSTLSPGDRLKLTAPPPDEVTTAIMTSVLKIIRSDK
jgi:hypothetical protein